MAELVFWILVVPAGLCGAWAFVVSRLVDVTQPLSALTPWQRAVRAFILPGFDDTPEQARLRSEINAIRSAGAEANRLRSTIGISSQIGRGRP